MATLQYLDLLLIFAGNRLSSRLYGVWNLGTVTNWISRCLIIAADINGIVQETNASGEMDHEHITLILFVLIRFAVLITYASRKSGIKKFLKKILNPPDNEIRTLSFKWLLFSLSSILTQVVCTTFIMSAAVEGYALLLGVIFMLPSAMNQFFVIYPIYYIVVLKILTKYEHRHLQRLTQSVKNDVGDINRLLEERAVVRSMKQEFEKLFNFIPFFTFGLLFISIPSTILSVFEDADDRKAYLIQKLVFFSSIHIAIFIVLFCLVLSVSRAKDSVNEAISGLVRGDPATKYGSTAEDRVSVADRRSEDG